VFVKKYTAPDNEPVIPDNRNVALAYMTLHDSARYHGAVAVDSQRRVLIVNQAMKRIDVHSLNGQWSRSFSSPFLRHPSLLAVSKRTGLIFVTEANVNKSLHCVKVCLFALQRAV
jgi:hypothetical protein